MAAILIKDDIYWVGVRDPGLRIFDAVMGAECESIALAEKKMHPCIGCQSCQEPQGGSGLTYFNILVSMLRRVASSVRNDLY